jgi:hypothetical protein
LFCNLSFPIPFSTHHKLLFIKPGTQKQLAASSLSDPFIVSKDGERTYEFHLIPEKLFFAQVGFYFGLNKI